jgi:predicted dehydrogenase
MKPELGFGVVGTGGIAADFCEALSRSGRCRVLDVCGTSGEKAEAFARRFGLPSASSELSQLLSNTRVDVVYIATPHPLHEAQALECIAHGKAVLCEKPLTLDSQSSARVIEAARARGVFLMEAFMYRCHPVIPALLSRLQAGGIGELRHLRADFGFRVPRDPQNRLFDVKLGGGGILDVGGYPMSLARLLAGIVVGSPFAEPTRLHAVGYVGPTGADELATAVLQFDSSFSANLTCSVHHRVGTRAVLFGEVGQIVLEDPWLPGGSRKGLSSSFTIRREGQSEQVVEVTAERPVYALQAELIADTLPDLEPPWPAMNWADSLGNMQALDAWRDALAR